MQKFIHDNEQYVFEVKRKQGKTKIDRDINEYFRKKNINNISLFNTNENNSMDNNNNNNYNMKLLNNSLLMNCLLLQNQLLFQQNNQNMENQISSSILPDNNDESKGLDIQNKNNKNEEIGKNQENKIGNDEEGKNQKENEEKVEKKFKESGERNSDNEGVDQKDEIIKKILEAINGQNNNINNSNEGKLTDPRKKVENKTLILIIINIIILSFKLYRFIIFIIISLK